MYKTIATCLLSCICASAHIAEAAEITIADTVLLEKTKNFGVNVSRDSYNAPMLKQRLNMNFEGTLYQHMFIAAEENDDSSGVLVGKTMNKSLWFKDGKKGTPAIIKHPDAEFWVVSGPNKGESLKLLSYEEKPAIMWGGKKDGLFLKFDKEVHVPPWGGIAFRLLNLSEGQLLCAGTGASNFRNCEISHDVPPTSKGQSSCLLNGRALHMTNIAYDNCSNTKGVWKLRFWAKGVDGAASLLLKFAQTEEEIPITGDWKEYNIERNITEDIVVSIKFVSNSDKILIDDVTAFKEGDTNDTAFNDDVLDVLRDLGTGMPLRSGDVCEGVIENMVGPRDEFYQHAWSPKMKAGPKNKHNSYFMSLHQLYDFCAKTGNEPWYILPGIMKTTEMEQFIEYLGAPADVGLGKLRAAQGQIQPWTEVLNEIHVEIGNETWNLMFWGANCNGADYWTDLINVAHNSPYWKDNISIILNERTHCPDHTKVTKLHTNGDAYDMAPYVIHEIKRDHTEQLDTGAKIFKWAFGKGVRFAKKHHSAYSAAAKNGGEYKIYEVNHHLMYNYAPVDFCQKFQASVGGGINIANSMLIHLKENKARTQCFFKLIGGGADKTTDKGIWGTVFSIDKSKRMYHPLFLAMQVVNKALGGDLLETTHNEVESFTSLREEEKQVELLVVEAGVEGAHKIPDEELENAGVYFAGKLNGLMAKEDMLTVCDWYVRQLRFTSDEVKTVHSGVVYGVLRGLAGRAARKIKELKEGARTVESVKEALKVFKKLKIKKIVFVDEEMQSVWSYAFKKGTKRSLILVNIDPEKERTFTLNLNSSVKGQVAQKHLLTSENITDANWMEDGKSTVTIENSTIENFTNGYEITLKPFSLQSIVWEE